MTATGHAVIGAVIAAKIGNPAYALPIALLSHLAADAFPHWDTGTNSAKKSRKAFVVQSFIDLGISLTLPFLLLQLFFPRTSFLYACIIIIAAQGFDWLSVPYVFFQWKFPPFSWPRNFQKLFDDRMDKPWGVIGQVWILLLLIWAAKIF